MPDVTRISPDDASLDARPDATSTLPVLLPEAPVSPVMTKTLPLSSDVEVPVVIEMAPLLSLPAPFPVEPV